MAKHPPRLRELNYHKMNQRSLTEHLLAGYDGAPNADSKKNPHVQPTRCPPSHTRFFITTIVFLLLSILGNVLLLRDNDRFRHISDLGRSRFSNKEPLLNRGSNTTKSRIGGLGYNSPVEYQSHSDYSNHNTTISGEHWEAIDTSPIVVALTDDYAREHDLELSVRFPWDNKKGIYHIKAFHHLHCLVSSKPKPRSLDSMLRINSVNRRTCARPTSTCSKATRPSCLQPTSITASTHCARTLCA